MRLILVMALSIGMAWMSSPAVAAVPVQSQTITGDQWFVAPAKSELPPNRDFVYTPITTPISTSAPQALPSPVTPTVAPTSTPIATPPVAVNSPEVHTSQASFDFVMQATPAAAPTNVSTVTATPSPVATPLPPAISTPAPVATLELDLTNPDFYRGSSEIAPLSPAQPAAATAAAGPSSNKLTPSSGEHSLLPAGGKAMYYNPGIMQEVYAYRLKLGQIAPCGECVGYVALLHKGDINRRVWLQWPDGGVEGPFLVIDVAASRHVAMLLSRGWVVDVDYSTALRHGMAGPVPVTVLDAAPVESR